MKELNKDQLLELAEPLKTNSACPDCSSLACEGWESVPSSFNLNQLQVLGTLRIEGADEYWEEYHPNGTKMPQSLSSIIPTIDPMSVNASVARENFFAIQNLVAIT